MKKMIMVLLAGSLLAVASTQSLAAWGMGGGDRHDKLVQKLGLTPEQKEKFKVNEEKIRAETSTQRAAIEKISEDLKVELKKEPADRDKIHGLVKQLGEQRTAMQLKRMDALLDLRALLTPEQRQKFSELAQAKKRIDLKGSPSGEARPKRRLAK